MSQLVTTTTTNQQKQKQRNLKTMLQWNIITNNKYQWQEQQVIPTNNNTKIEMMTITAMPFHKQWPKHLQPARKNNMKIETMTKSGTRYHKQQNQN